MRPAALSALVDGALEHAERERLLTHLAGCPACRREADELRRVRDLLGSSGLARPVQPPTQLSRRLVDIAGEDAASPLWTRPFDPPRHGGSALPMRHRVLRQRVGTASVLAAVLLMTFATVGWSAAPAASTPVTDPGPRSQSSFGAALTQVPLATEGMAALLLSGSAGLERLREDGRPASEAGDLRRDQPITADEALVVLQNSAMAGAVLPRSGRQDVQVQVGGDVVRASVDVAVQPGQSTQVTVWSAAGEQVGAGSLAVQDAPAPVELLGTRHTLSGFLRAGTVAGREASVVEAREGVDVVARWWVDAETGLLLRTERYDDGSGRATAVSGFTSVDIGSDTFSVALAPRLATFGGGVVSLSEAPRLSAQGWSCEDELGGLPLVQLRTSADGSLLSAYSDGVRTVAVVQQHGTLADQPAGFEWDESLAAWRRTDSLPAQLVWQSGERVITVTTDSPDGTVWDAVAELPHDEPEHRTGVERVLEGWQRIGSLVLQR
ncbi:zf-HC2 domain-containing protein [Auraticoccus monumenti]|uniref:zf-HC2 domain-containing protein n=1 Tax=Auraticoccus monumenti TaxID=675864 RepID=UPI00155F99C1|nr:zf-HC2 domain-containing protein [Auraticoccus monumenti]